MDSPELFENALADEILAEVARQRRTAKSVQQEAEVQARAWTNYLTARTRHIPMRTVVSICDALGVAPSEMLRRAESRADDLAAQHDAAAERGLANLPPDLAERVRRVDREGRDAQEDDPQSSERLTRPDRSAMTG